MAELQPVTFLVPSSAAEPVEVRVTHSGLRMVLLTRASVDLLDDTWKVLGVYFLLGPADDDPERFRAYVGEVGRRTLRTRIKEHQAEKAWWSRALLITSASNDFNSAEIGWLEGRLWDVLNNAVAADLANKGRPGDDSLPVHDRAVLERYVEPITAALRACGFPPDTVDQKPAPKGKKRTVYTESVKDLIDAGLLKVDTKLVPMRKQLTELATVLADGQLQVAGTTYSSVSSAAQAVSGNQSEPGWEFWGAPSGDGRHVQLFDLRARLREDTRPHHPTPSAPAAAPVRSLLDDPVDPPTPSARPARRRYDVSVADLIAAGKVTPGETLTSVRRKVTALATVQPDGTIELAGVAYPTLSAAAQAASDMKSEPGWEFWTVERDGQHVRLFDIRAEHIATREAVSQKTSD